jgi:hypothetical protein
MVKVDLSTDEARSEVSAAIHVPRPGQRPDAKQNGQHTAPALARPCPSVRRTAPEPGTHGNIADGGSPESRLASAYALVSGG